MILNWWAETQWVQPHSNIFYKKLRRLLLFKLHHTTTLCLCILLIMILHILNVGSSNYSLILQNAPLKFVGLYPNYYTNSSLFCHILAVSLRQSFFFFSLSSKFYCQSFGATLNALCKFSETLKSALVGMINPHQIFVIKSLLNVSLSGENINSCVTFQELFPSRSNNN